MLRARADVEPYELVTSVANGHERLERVGEVLQPGCVVVGVAVDDGARLRKRLALAPLATLMRARVCARVDVVGERHVRVEHEPRGGTALPVRARPARSIAPGPSFVDELDEVGVVEHGGPRRPRTLARKADAATAGARVPQRVRTKEGHALRERQPELVLEVRA